MGLGHAVWCAREVVGNEPFALLLPDVLVQNKPGCLAQMIGAYNAAGQERQHHRGRRGADGSHPAPMAWSVLATPRARGFAITEMVEKPPLDEAPSNLIITGRYILRPEIFDVLAAQTRGAGGEIQLTDAMIELAKTQPFYGLKFEGKSFDCGSKVGFLSANVAYALERADLGPALRAEIKKRPRETRERRLIKAKFWSPRRCCRHTSARSPSACRQSARPSNPPPESADAGRG